MAPFVKNVVEKTSSHLTVINVIQDPRLQYPASTAFTVPPGELDQMLTASRKFLDEYVAEAFPGGGVNAVCKMGNPATEIIRRVKTAPIDLIIMPTRGTGPFRRLLLGSVTAKVLDEAICPVWTDAHTEQEGRSLEFPVRRILCAVDQKEQDVAIIRCAAEMAKMSGATLNLIHVVPELDPSLKMLRPEWVHEFHESAKEKVGLLRDRAGTNAEICIQEGPISTRIQQTAIAQRADLIVIGRGHLQTFLGRLRTNAYAIIRDSPCSVLSV